MPIPKRRTTRSSRGQRRSHDALKKLNLTTCSKCKESIMPHRTCRKCGTYAGKQIVEIKNKEDKKKASQKEQKTQK